jgi:hypothetical protein
MHASHTCAIKDLIVFTAWWKAASRRLYLVDPLVSAATAARAVPEAVHNCTQCLHLVAILP